MCIHRCVWAKSALMKEYHDNEWGRINHCDIYLFEILILETMQTGLSWEIVLKKRTNYREAFYGFDFIKVSQMQSTELEELLDSSGIIKHKAKIFSIQSNAKAYISIKNEYNGFYNYIWSFVNNKQIVNKIEHHKQIQTKSELSELVSKDLKKRGFKFVGSTTIYSYLQAIGVINDHENDCFVKFVDVS